MYIAYNLDIYDVNSCTRNKINFSKDNIARGLCTLVPFIYFCIDTSTISQYGNLSLQIFYISPQPLVPGAPVDLQVFYPAVVWLPPVNPNGVIINYELTFRRGGQSRTVNIASCQTHYVIRTQDIPGSSGQFTVEVKLFFARHDHFQGAQPVLLTS